MAAALRSLATRMARVPPRHHRLFAARTCSSGGSSPPPPPPPPTSNEDLHAHDKKLLRELDCAKAQFKRNAIHAAWLLVFSGLFFYASVKPTLDELRDRIESLSRQNMKMKNYIMQITESDFERYIEVGAILAQTSEAKSIQTSGSIDLCNNQGHGKEPDGHQADQDEA